MKNITAIFAIPKCIRRHCFPQRESPLFPGVQSHAVPYMFISTTVESRLNNNPFYKAVTRTAGRLLHPHWISTEGSHFVLGRLIGWA